MTTRKITKVSRGHSQHWVGDGFPVRTMFSYHADDGISPFLLLDYAGPAKFEPADKPRGVETHPHRGFETVTIVYNGELEHKDSAGNSGKIGPGDVQWMTAARGILHEEMHSRDFTAKGGIFEVAQLWVNLPATHKMDAPGYQELTEKTIPQVKLANEAGIMRVIAGDVHGIKGAAKTFTPVTVLDIRLNAGATVTLPVTDGHHVMALVMRGKVQVDDETVVPAEIAFFSNDGDSITLTAKEAAIVLLMAGEPIHEPVEGYGPFVMNTREEINQAVIDYHSGRF